MKSIKHLSTIELAEQIRELDSAIKEYELYFEKPDGGTDETQTIPNAPD